jgi:flagellar hook assembly protein FlgD
MISYELPSECFVKLKIYNILGKEVKTLVNARQTTGNYKIFWNGKNEQEIDMVSGVYFYHILVNSLINKTGKMLLIR